MKAMPLIHVKKNCTIEISIQIWQVFIYSLLYFIQFVASNDDLLLGSSMLH